MKFIAILSGVFHLVFLGALPVETARATPVFINEIHYDNSGGDLGEGIEIAGPANTDLTGWQLVLYNGGNGSPYNSIALSGILGDLSNGFGVLSFGVNGIQNGAPDGVALVDAFDQVQQFLSYEGVMTASEGVAVGLSSLDIGVSEASTAAVGSSLQLTGMGTLYSDFSWVSGVSSSFGALNENQQFSSLETVAEPDPVWLWMLALPIMVLWRRRGAGRSA